MTIMKKWFKARIGSAFIFISRIAERNRDRGVIGRSVFIAYNKYLKICDMSLLPVLSVDAYREITGNVKITTIESNRFGVMSNIVYARSGVSPQTKKMPLSDLSLQQYNNVCIRGNSDIIVDVSRNYVVSDAAFNLPKNEDVIDGLLYRTKGKICLLRDNLRHPKKRISSGIMLSGKFCNNYYHVMYENLIRCVYLDRINVPQYVPLVVDKRTMMIPSCRQIFDILTAKSGRDVITIDDVALYQFDCLFCLSRVNQLPSHTIDPQKPINVIYSVDAMKLLRKNLLAYKSAKITPRRFFISRKKGGGRQFNEEEVFVVLSKYGFVRIAPEQYSFDEQIALFNNAEFIVAGTGAALTNLLFVSNSCTVICFGLGSYDKTFDIPVFNTVASIIGASFIYFPRKNSLKKDVHINYEIDCEDFEDWMSTMIL